MIEVERGRHDGVTGHHRLPGHGKIVQILQHDEGELWRTLLQLKDFEKIFFQHAGSFLQLEKQLEKPKIKN
jgi:hypothetical protein